MKSLILCVFCLFFSGLSTALPAPEFSVGDKQLSDLKGQVIYLDFWASWCKPCRKSFPWMNRMTEKYGTEGLKVIAVNLDSDATLANQFLAKIPAQFQIVYNPDGSIAKQYQLPGMPSSYIIDKSGEIRVAHKGFHLDKTQQYESELVSLLKE
ncbi:TlpA disulfide reductase family protein [Aliiglaciecola sp. LCG003]|uniref:TlpA family protein disulfide reductase n=1 Tax=Aliiglaciecola sp. LCG003 TaxID=3053655 RepID=UPI0025742F35|nr:TlpA disulfide reductase family protein [Aliiglaciecola sp. LCG003]WJG09266.1 TlpA disulfide reductase family protein [Aliiglaciecola sp. LCG003]